MQICFVLYCTELDFCVDDFSGVYLFSLSCCQLSIFLANESNFISLRLLAGLNTDKEFNILFQAGGAFQGKGSELKSCSHRMLVLVPGLVHDIINL